MSNIGPEKSFNEFIFDSAIPAGVKLVLLAYLILSVYFLAVFVLLTVLIIFDLRPMEFELLLIAIYSLVCFLFFSIASLPLWRAWYGSRILTFLGFALLTGYSAVWFYLGLFFISLAYLFFLTGLLTFLYVMTGRNAVYYYGGQDKYKLSK